MDFAEVFAEALRRMARDEAFKTKGCEAVARYQSRHGLPAVRQWLALGRECASRADTYSDWAAAVAFPGGPVHADYVRNGFPWGGLI